jgi:hypothetical protein
MLPGRFHNIQDILLARWTSTANAAARGSHGSQGRFNADINMALPCVYQ